MARSSSPIFRFTVRDLLVACCAAGVVGAGVYHWYSSAGDKSPSPAPTSLATPVNQGPPKPTPRSSSPLEDLAAAQEENDPERRAALIRAALQAWARVSPDEAAKWVLKQAPQQRLVNASVVLIALADRAEDAVCVANYFCKEDPAYVREHGNSLLAVLTASGEFERAVSFASLGGPERGEWITRTFATWTELAPSEAAQAALALQGDDMVSIVFTTWAARNRAAADRFLSAEADSAAAQRAAVLALAGQAGKTGR